jgi:hypothetical protein
VKSLAWHERRKALLRARQIRSLTERRKTVNPTDSRILKAARQPEVLLAMCEARGIPMSIPEVALRLGLSVNGVKLIEQRALAKVRRALGVGT